MLFVIDIEVVDKQTTITGTNITEIDERMNSYLTKLLQQYELLQFEKSLAIVGYLDRSENAELLLTQYRTLEKDLAFINQIELLQGAVKSLNYGHGLPTFYSSCFGPCIHYYINPKEVEHLGRGLLTQTLQNSIFRVLILF
jgi:hypothetical protein